MSRSLREQRQKRPTLDESIRVSRETLDKSGSVGGNRPLVPWANLMASRLPVATMLDAGTRVAPIRAVILTLIPWRSHDDQRQARTAVRRRASQRSRASHGVDAPEGDSSG